MVFYIGYTMITYTITIVEDATIGQLADRFETTDREEADAWAADGAQVETTID